MSRLTEGPFFIGLIVAGMIAGGLVGGITGETYTAIHVIAVLFMNALRMMVIPLVAASMITSIASMSDLGKLRRLGLATLSYYLVTTFAAVVTGLVMVNLIKPGMLSATVGSGTGGPVSGDYSLSTVVTGMLPSNIFATLASGEVLPIIVVSLIFGTALASIGRKGKAVFDFFDGIFMISMKIVKAVIVLAPLGVFALVEERVGKAGGWTAFSSELGGLGLYMLTVMAGLAIHGLITLPVILSAVGRYNPVKVVKGLFEALSMAFSTASSSATLPVTMNCLEQIPGSKRKVSAFVLPLGATVNMDGTALYEAVAAVFIAQSFGIELTIVQQAVIALTATLAAIGAAGIPEAGLVTMVLVLRSAGLPLEGIGMILAVDWFLDRCRTTVNVWGDAVGALILARGDLTDRDKSGE